MKVQVKQKENYEISVMQKALIDYFDPKIGDFETRMESLEWVIETCMFDFEEPLTIDMRMHIYDMKKLHDILKGLKQGF